MAWQRNRSSDLVAWVRTVAETCDRLEYLLSGRDED